MVNNSLSLYGYHGICLNLIEPFNGTPVEFLRPPYQTRLVTINTEAFIAPLSIEPFEAALFSKTPKP